jgi:hypothetical protein
MCRSVRGQGWHVHGEPGYARLVARLCFRALSRMIVNRFPYFLYLSPRLTLSTPFLSPFFV